MTSGNFVKTALKTTMVVIVLSLSFVGWSTAQAQGQPNTIPITLQNVLEWGGANNLTIKGYARQQELANADAAKAKEWWLPEIYLGANIHRLSGTAMNSDGRFYRKVDQQNFWSGLGLNATWDFGKGLFQSKAALLKAEANKYLTQARRNEVLLHAIDAYYDFLAAQLYFKTYGQLAAQSDTIARQLQTQVGAGLAFQSDLLMAQSNYRHVRIEMLSAKTEYEQSNAVLVSLLDLPPNTHLVSADTLLVPAGLFSDGNDAINMDSAFRARPEYSNLQLTRKAFEIQKKTATTGLLLPEIRLGTYGAYYGGVFEPFDPTSAINASVSWHIPIGAFTYRGSIKQYDARIAMEGNKLEQLKNQVAEEVSSASARMQNARAQMEIAKEGVSLSRQAMRQSMQRQALGTVRPYEIRQTQEVFIEARLDYLKAVTDFNKAQYHLFVASGNDL